MKENVEYQQMSFNDINGISDFGKEDKVIVMPLPPESSKSFQERKNDRTKNYNKSKKVSLKRKTVPMPQILKDSEKSKNINEFLNMFGFYGIEVKRNLMSAYSGYSSYVFDEDNKQTATNIFKETSIKMMTVQATAMQYTSMLLYFDESGNGWSSKFHLKKVCGYLNDDSSMKVEMDPIEWKSVNKIIYPCVCVQDGVDVDLILKVSNPYGYQWLQNSNYQNLKNHPEFVLMAPELELIDKAGYSIVIEINDKIHSGKTSIYDSFNRVCQQGRNINEIFKTTKAVYSTLKDEADICAWDVYRKLDKTGRISGDNVKILYEGHYDAKQLDQLNSILCKKYHGKSVFTWDSLINYLERVDTFEAIERDEALMLISDYLDMCRLLDVEPKIDGDSLKREHDVMARMCRYKRQEIYNEGIKRVAEENSIYNYSDGSYTIRICENYDDLIDEAQQQHNCVACYASKIANESSLIFFMRRTCTPERSLITVEISPEGKIRQKYLAYNKTVKSISQNEFLKAWQKRVVGMKRKKNK